MKQLEWLTLQYMAKDIVTPEEIAEATGQDIETVKEVMRNIASDQEKIIKEAIKKEDGE